MVVALAVFALGKPFFAVETPGRCVTTPEERREQWQVLGKLFGVFAIISFFWMAYEHNDSLWVFFIRDYVDRTVPLLNRTVPPDQIQFLNALFVLIFIPTLTAVFKFTDPDQRLFTAANRILLGFLVTAGATGIMSAAGFLSQGGAVKISVVWMALAYIVLTLGEVLVYSTGLELSYTAAPKSMKGFVTACFLLTITLGNFINTGFARLYGGSLTDPPEARGPLSPGAFFGLTTVIVLAAAVAFYFVGRRLSHREEARQPPAASAA
jgi:POT family proton-dependent oligopeptide transporter